MVLLLGYLRELGVAPVLALALVSFDQQALATAKRLLRRHGSAPVEDYRGTLEALRDLITSPSTAERRAVPATSRGSPAHASRRVLWRSGWNRPRRKR